MAALYLAAPTGVATAGPRSPVAVDGGVSPMDAGPGVALQPAAPPDRLQGAGLPLDAGLSLETGSPLDAGLPPDAPDAGPRPKVGGGPPQHGDAVGAGEAGTAAPETAGAEATSAEAAPEEDRPAFLHATVNGIDAGDIFVVLRGNDALVKLEDLQKPGLRIDWGTREMYGGEEVLVSLRSLAPRVRFVVDERNLTLTVTADPKLFSGRVLDLRAQRPEGIIYGTAPSVFVNYQVSGSELQSGRRARVSGFAESGLSLDGHLLYASGQRSAVDGSWERLLTNLTFDLRNRLSSIVLGDFNATSDALGGSAMLGGLSVARNFGLDPYYYFLPSQRLSGTALTPSTVEVYVNGQLVRREQLPPGQFTMQNLPVTSGSGETRVVVRDASGATQTIETPYYMALGTLAKGLHDFSYSLGFQRRSYGSASLDYGEPALLFRHRMGVTNWLTIGARMEGTLHMASGGPNLALRLPAGELGASGAVSEQEGFAGGAVLLSYSYMGQPGYAQAGFRYQSRDYANLGIQPASLPPPNALPPGVPSAIDRQHFDVLTSLAKNISKVASLSLRYEATNWWSAGWTHQVTLMGNRTINRWMYLFATVGSTFQTGMTASYSTFVGVSFAPANRLTAGVTRTDHWGGSSGYGGGTQGMVQQSLPIGPGLGYRVVATQGENDLNQADLQYQGAYGRVEADYQHEGYGSAERGHAMLSATGGLVLIGGRPFVTRPIQDSYALIRVPGVEGVHGTLSNQVVGTTNAHGDLLIPSLLHYYGNRVGIDDKDIPLDHQIAATERTIAPPYRGGVIVPFPVRRVQSVAGTVTIDAKGRTIVPTYGQIVVTAGDRQVISPLDELGNFYLEDLAPGSYPAEVQYETGACDFRLAVPAGSAALVNLGAVQCKLSPEKSP